MSPDDDFVPFCSDGERFRNGDRDFTRLLSLRSAGEERRYRDSDFGVTERLLERRRGRGDRLIRRFNTSRPLSSDRCLDLDR